MKNLENMKALDEIELVKVSGGDDDYTVVDAFVDCDAFVDWLLSPVEEALNNIADNVAGGSDDDDRPLPFPQNRRGNKAPFEAPHKAGPLFL